MTEVPPDLAFLQWLIDEAGMWLPRPIPGHRWAALQPKMFTTAIAIGQIGDHNSIDTHWCYETPNAAARALLAWDGIGEPQGWFRHPDTGRRLSRTGEEIDENGDVVGAVGVLYRRW